jgi:fimbrial chaperone protein
MNLPIFAKPQTSTAPKLHWKMGPAQANGVVGITVRNEGDAHVQLANLVLAAPGASDPVATYQGFVYVLPGETRLLSLKPSQPISAIKGAGLHLKGYSDAGAIDADVAPENR